MAELDFSKIFGETATSKASFTDENYLNGWGYLGSTPPPYQLFDYLQSLNDKKAKYLYDGLNESKNNLLTHNKDSSAHADIRQKFNDYLPLTGGTVTGALNVPTQPTTDNSVKVANTAFVKSAHVQILNAIKAISGMSDYDIAPSKTIATMIPLLGFGGIVAQRLENNGYVKFANGFTIQWVLNTFNKYVTWPINMSTPLAAVATVSIVAGDTSLFTTAVDIRNSNVYIRSTRNGNADNDIYGWCIGLGF